MIALTLEAVVLLLLILLNGFLSLSEIALIAARPSRLRLRAEAGDRGAAAAIRLIEQPERFFSTVQVGITLIGVLTGAVGSAAFADRLAPLLASWPVLAPYADVASVAVVVLSVSYCTLVLGELTPKRLAYAAPERIAAIVAPSMRLLLSLALPAVHFLSWSTRLVVGVLGLHRAQEPSVTEEDIRALIHEGVRVGVLEHDEREMLERIIRLGDRQVGAMMTPRVRIDWLDLDDPAEENLRRMVESPHSRFPVARGDIAETVGVLKAKEYLAACCGGLRPAIGEKLSRPLFVPETMRAGKLVELFKERERLTFALVVDEYGDVVGCITLNDILEAIVGEIPERGVPPEPQAVRRADGSWLIDAATPFDEVEQILRLPPEAAQGGHHTLAGYVLARMGRIPEIGDLVEADGYSFEVVDKDGNRLDRFLVRSLNLPEED